jgi:hypothetical protein
MLHKLFIKNLYCCIAAGFFCTSIFSQTISTFTIKAGEDISAVYKQAFKYPQFRNGKVVFSYGSPAGGKMNYNLIIGKIQFIDEKNDTLVIADEAAIKFITIGTDTFYYDRDNYVELLANYGEVKMALQERIKFVDEKNIGAFGIPTSTKNIDNYNTLRANNTYSLKVNKDLVYSKESKYYFSEGESNFLVANKKNILKEFPSKRTVIENYLKQHDINYNNEEDLKSLFGYLATH